MISLYQNDGEKWWRIREFLVWYTVQLQWYCPHDVVVNIEDVVVPSAFIFIARQKIKSIFQILFVYFLWLSNNDHDFLPLRFFTPLIQARGVVTESTPWHYVFTPPSKTLKIGTNVNNNWNRHIKLRMLWRLWATTQHDFLFATTRWGFESLFNTVPVTVQ
jgi:hypothetical protein